MVTKRLCAIMLGALLLAGTAACATVPPSPDVMGLHYSIGEVDGYKFNKCVPSGTNGDSLVNDEIYWLPVNLRTWVIDDMPDPTDPNKSAIAPGADSANVTTVPAKPEKDQPSGVQVKVSTKTSFYLNTFCDASGGVAREFWEKLGRKHGADTAEGWRKMLEAEFVTILAAAIKDVVRNYPADDFVANKDGIHTTIQTEVSKQLAAEFSRVTGGKFFCGPTFNRTKQDCPDLEVRITGAELADRALQAARNEKQKQVELAAAALAKAEGESKALLEEARGKKNAAAEIAALYNNPGWVKLQETILKTQALIEACKAAKECKLIVGPDGNLIMA